jgi:DNA repair exonuclease SbcCD ATPase subunit
LVLRTGTTFIVASNGVGKTSMLEGLAWAIHGEAAFAAEGGRPMHAVRLGADEAEATVDLRLGDGSLLEIKRTLPRRLAKNRQAPVEMRINGENVTIDRGTAALLEHLGGDQVLLARLTVIREHAHLDATASRLDLRSHLSRIFGIAGLQGALIEIDSDLRACTRRVTELKHARRGSQAELDRLQLEVADAETSARAAAEARNQARQVAMAANEALAVARALVEMNARSAQAAAARSRIEAAVAELTGGEGDPDLESVLGRIEQSAQSRIDVVRARRSFLDGRIATIIAALDELEGASGRCPVCRRTLEPEDVEAARAEHAADVARLTAERESLDESDATARLATARRLRSELAAVPLLVAAPEATVPLEEARLASDHANADLDAASVLLAERASAREIAKRQLGELTRSTQEADELRSQFQLEAGLLVSKRAIEEVVRTVVSVYMEPLVAEIANRWKILFPQRGSLRLEPDGAVSREVGVAEGLPYEAFSAGEKMAALLLIRLLAVDAATASPFCMIDEPLEQLDPDARRQVASMLANATLNTGLEQVLVTTYEEALVRTLADRLPDVQVLHVRDRRPPVPELAATQRH